MNMDQIINMVMRTLVRQGVRGVTGFARQKMRGGGMPPQAKRRKKQQMQGDQTSDNNMDLSPEEIEAIRQMREKRDNR